MVKEYNDPMEATLDVIGGKWKGLIMWYLHNGTKRFSELQRLIPGITQKMLTKQLRDLESHGLITRKVYPQVPPKVEYSVTEYGETTGPIFADMHAWGVNYVAISKAKVKTYVGKVKDSHSAD